SKGTVGRIPNKGDPLMKTQTVLKTCRAWFTRIGTTARATPKAKGLRVKTALRAGSGWDLHEARGAPELRGVRATLVPRRTLSGVRATLVPRRTLSGVGLLKRSLGV